MRNKISMGEICGEIQFTIHKGAENKGRKTQAIFRLFENIEVEQLNFGELFRVCFSLTV